MKAKEGRTDDHISPPAGGKCDPTKFCKDMATSNQSQIHTESGPLYIGPFIDKLSVTLWFPHDKRIGIENNIKGAFQHASVFQKAKPNSLYFASRLLVLKSSPETVRMDCFPRNSAAADCRFEFNPSKIGWEGVANLDTYLTDIFDGGWDYVVSHARVSRIDVAVDLINIVPDQFLFISQGGTWRRDWRREGTLETLAYGNRRSNQWLIYNKTAEQKSKGIFMNQQVVRVERVLRNPNMALKDLKDLPNPFKTLVLSQIMPAPPSWEKPEKWQIFLDSVLVRGVGSALALQSHNKRSKYRTYLKSVNCPWWQPDLIWSKWPVAIADLQ